MLFLGFVFCIFWVLCFVFQLGLYLLGFLVFRIFFRMGCRLLLILCSLRLFLFLVLWSMLWIRICLVLGHGVVFLFSLNLLLVVFAV